MTDRQADAPSSALAAADRIFDRVSEQAYFVPVVTDRVPIAHAAKVRGVEPVWDWLQGFENYWIAQ